MTREKLRYHIWPALVAAVIVILAGWIWDTRASVAWFEEADLVSHKTGLVQMRVTAYKVRDCKFIADSEVGYVMIDELWEESALTFVNDQSPGNSHPHSIYRTSLGIWEWRDEIPPPQEIQAVMATVSHDCGDGELRTTKFGPFSL